ncbi:MAG: rod shape-determining protein MreD [Muribaculaceae bacterium]|nr:rod shape-determining protein MreD [Muribaculaceae bacterium]
MSKDILSFAVLFVVMILLQALIFNHIVLFSVAVPLVFIYFIIRLPISLPTGWLLTFSFLLGLAVDVFSDTPGVNALGCTLLAAMKRPAFFAYVPRDDKTKEAEPTLSTLGWVPYCKYLLTMTGIYCFLALAIEYFNFASVKTIAIMTVASTILTFLLLLAVDCLIVRKREKRL